MKNICNNDGEVSKRVEWGKQTLAGMLIPVPLAIEHLLRSSNACSARAAIARAQPDDATEVRRKI